VAESSSKLTTVEVLERALELLGPDGKYWVNSLPMRTCDFCVVTAVSAACPTYSIAPALAKIREAAGLSKHAAVDIWNDAPERTFPEVRAAFLKAIALAKAEQGAAHV